MICTNGYVFHVLTLTHHTTHILCFLGIFVPLVYYHRIETKLLDKISLDIAVVHSYVSLQFSTLIWRYVVFSAKVLSKSSVLKHSRNIFTGFWIVNDNKRWESPEELWKRYRYAFSLLCHLIRHRSLSHTLWSFVDYETNTQKPGLCFQFVKQ